MKATHKILTAAVFLAAAGIGLNAQAGSIENMERERAIMLQTMLDPNMSQEERHSKAKLSQKRLIDLERIVLRDKSLDGRNTPLVKRVFADYDSSFLVHASAEKNLSVTDHWFEQLGLSTNSLLAASRRRR
jgi:hypothetical protein